MRDDYCLGRYGFTIKSDGAFVAGPSDRGSKVDGRIKPVELRRLDDLIIQVFASPHTGGKVCRPGGLPGIKDQVDITLSTGSVVRVYDLGGSVGEECYLGTGNHVRKLHDYLRKMMTRYYPLPFP
jgi:hypothetical protein